jgi:DNA-binding protein H-NS
MSGSKHNNRINRNQGYLATSEPNSPTIASPGYTITPEKQDIDLKSPLMVMMEEFKKEIQKNTGKQLEAIKEEAQKSLRELQENTTKQVMDLNKTIQDLKIEVEKKNKELTKGDNSGDRNPRKEIRNHRCEHQQQNTRDGRENLRCRRVHRKHGHNNQRKCKMLKDPNSKHPGNPGHNEKTKSKINRNI